MKADGAWTVLAVNNEARVRGSLMHCLEEDYRVLATASSGDALHTLDNEEVDLVLCDHRIPDINAVEFFRKTRISHPEVIRIMMIGQTDHREMIRSINEAAVYEVVPKPWQPEHVLLLVRRALESRELARRHRYLSRELKFADTVLRRQNEHMAKLLQDSYEFDKLVFASDSMGKVCDLARKAAVTDLPVMIQGETGTGKELMARAVHFFSTRKGFPFLAQNCGAMPDDLLHSELFGHKRGALPGPSATGGDCFPPPMEERYFWMKYRKYPRRFKSACCAFCRKAKSSHSEPTRHDIAMCASSPRPINP